MKNRFTKLRRALALAAVFAAASLTARAQGVGVGTTAPDASAALDIVSSSKGALLPRLTSAQRTAIASPATGLMVFQTDGTTGFYYNSGTPGAPVWQQITTAAGTSTSFIQNQNAGDQAANFRISGNGSTLGNFGVGTSAPSQKLEVQGNVFIPSANDYLMRDTNHGMGWYGTGKFWNGVNVDGPVVYGFNGGLLGINQGGIRTSALLWNAAGNVGIGTTAPGTRLQVVSADNTTNTFADFQPQNLTQGVGIWYGGIRKTGTNATSDLALDGKDTGHVVLNANGGTGNVGIGTGAPTAKLDVDGSTRLRGLTTAGLVTTDASGNLSSATAASFGTSFIQNQTSADQAANFRISGSGYVAGSMGIGTTAANSRLSITPTATEPKITLWDGGSTTSHYGLGISPGQINYHVGSTGASHVFYAGGKNGDGAELLRILGTGNVGIGTSAPDTRLQVVSTDNSVATTIIDAQAQNLTYGTSLWYGGIRSTGTNPSNALYLDGKGTGQVVLNANGGTGNVGIGTGGPTQKLEVAGQVFSSTGGFRFPDNTVQTTAATAPAAQTLSLSGQNLSISGGNTVALPTAAGDNLGNHTATQNLNLQGNALTGTGASIGTTVGVGVRADGGLNLGQNNANNLLALGFQAGQASTGFGNQFVGYLSGFRNTTGLNNQFDGYQSGYNTTTGSYNQFNGYQSGYSNTTGNNNLFSGHQSGFSNTTGNWNQFIGYQSGMSNNAGINNVFSGFNSGFNNSGGNYNIFHGNYSGYRNTSGNNNLFSGHQSGSYNTTGSDNTALGYNSGPANGSGAIINATALGANVTLTQSNTVILGNNANVGIGTTAPAYKLDVSGDINASGQVRAGGVVLTSDRRLKRNIAPSAYGLSTVLGLRPVQYEKKATIQSNVYARPEIGFIAQELQVLLPTLVSAGPDADKTLAVSYTELIPVLTKAIQEQQAQIEALKAQNAALQTKSAQADSDHASLITLQQQMARLLGESAPAGAQARK